VTKGSAAAETGHRHSGIFGRAQVALLGGDRLAA